MVDEWVCHDLYQQERPWCDNNTRGASSQANRVIHLFSCVEKELFYDILISIKTSQLQINSLMQIKTFHVLGALEILYFASDWFQFELDLFKFDVKMVQRLCKRTTQIQFPRMSIILWFIVCSHYENPASVEGTAFNWARGLPKLIVTHLCWILGSKNRGFLLAAFCGARRVCGGCEQKSLQLVFWKQQAFCLNMYRNFRYRLAHGCVQKRIDRASYGFQKQTIFEYCCFIERSRRC